MEITLELALQLFVLFLLFNYAMLLINGLLKLITEHFLGKNIFQDNNPNDKNYSKLDSIKETIKNTNSEIKGIKSSITSYGNKVASMETKLNSIIEQTKSVEQQIIVSNDYVEKLAKSEPTCTCSNTSIMKVVHDKALQLISSKTNMKED